jgi:hypothetical protein
MKNLLLTLLILPLFAAGQLPYSWTTGVNPGLTSSNPTNNTLSWQGSITTVSTSGFNNGTGSWYRYNNNQNTTYTSQVLNFTGCNTSSFVQVTVNLDVNMENNWDFLYFQYSTNNGTTWTTLGTYTGGLGAINPVYTVSNLTNRFRFLFTSDPTVNSYGNGANTFIYYADILGFNVICPTFLPVELISFKGFKETKGNRLVWEIESETNCDYYTIERSIDWINWQLIKTIDATGSNLYYIMDREFEPGINYYRLSQVDTDGMMVVYDPVSIDNRESKLSVVSVTNTLGQSINEPYHGIVIFTYEDGSTEKKYFD